MPYRVLLVDDERFDLEWLVKAFPWKDLSLEVAGTANSGFEALKIMEREPIDLLVSDIRMPIMSGLELAQKAKELRPELNVIFISGYQDFEYAKQAIGISALGYLLKPLNEAEIMSVLKEAVGKMDKERSLLERSDTLDRTLPLIKRALIHEWLEGRADRSEYKSILSSYGIRLAGPVNAAVVEIDDLEWTLNRYPIPEQEELVKRVWEVVRTWAGDRMVGQPYEHAGRMTLLLDRIEDSTAVLLLEELTERIRKRTPFTATIGLGLPEESPERLPDCYRQALEALRYKMYLGKSRVIVPGDLKRAVLQEAADVDGILRELFACMMEYDLVGIDDHMSRAFDAVRLTDTRMTAYNFTLHLFAELDKQFRTLGENLYDILSWDYTNLDVLFRFETLDDIKSWTRRRLFELSELMMRKKLQRGNRKIVYDMADYAEARIGDKVTLRELSQVFGFTPNYLGHLFKEEFGETFNEYMARKRMEKACELLANPTIKIYEISDRVGHKNIIYFNRQFKDTYGMTPTEYRNKLAPQR